MTTRLLEAIYGPEDLAAVVKGGWRRETGVASDEAEHAVWLTNDDGDTLIVNADDAATLLNGLVAMLNHAEDIAALIEAAGRHLDTYHRQDEHVWHEPEECSVKALADVLAKFEEAGSDRALREAAS